MTPQEPRQRDHELNRPDALVAAIEDANAVIARLLNLGDRDADLAVVRSLRDSLQRDLDEQQRRSA